MAIFFTKMEQNYIDYFIMYTFILLTVLDTTNDDYVPDIVLNT